MCFCSVNRHRERSQYSQLMDVSIGLPIWPDQNSVLKCATPLLLPILQPFQILNQIKLSNRWNLKKWYIRFPSIDREALCKSFVEANFNNPLKKGSQGGKLIFIGGKRNFALSHEIQHQIYISCRGIRH